MPPSNGSLQSKSSFRVHIFLSAASAASEQSHGAPYGRCICFSFYSDYFLKAADMCGKA